MAKAKKTVKRVIKVNKLSKEGMKKLKGGARPSYSSWSWGDAEKVTGKPTKK